MSIFNVPPSGDPKSTKYDNKTREIAEKKANELINIMTVLTNDDRCTIFHYLEQNFCHYCGDILGGDKKTCHCMNDE